MIFADHFSLAICAAIFGLILIVSLIRRPRLPRSSMVFALLGLLLLTLSAGRPTINWPNPGTIAVMVDLSPSTRTAAYRDPAWLRQRLSALLGDRAFELVFFASSNQPGSLDSQSSLPDLSADKTIFDPPPADVVVLFSDGQFDPPRMTLPPIYPVIDPALQDVASQDARITAIEFRGNHIAISIENPGPPRTLTIQGALGPTTEQVQGTQTILRPIDPKSNQIWATLSPRDPWPENDAMSIPVPPPATNELWWIGANPPTGWRAFSPTDLPTDPTDDLSPAVIVLNNITADDLTAIAQARLEQYVRDLGGSLLILGGDHSFAAGAYVGTTLDRLSPLASSPPRPTRLWIILADASGSMSTPVGDTTRWNIIANSLAKLLPRMPPDDPVRIGQFSNTLRWWSDGQSAKQTVAMNLPPADAFPHGPTNLEPVLNAIAADPSGGQLDKELLLLTDADVDIDHPLDLAHRMSANKIHFHFLAIEHGSGLGTLNQIAAATGGSSLTELDPTKWADSLTRLIQSSQSNLLKHQSFRALVLGQDATANMINQTWPKRDATLLAKSDESPLAALWRVGLGQVMAVSFAADSSLADSLSHLIAEPPRDPRLKITWRADKNLTVTVDAIDGTKYLNNLNLKFQISNLNFDVSQTAPGYYSLSIPAPREPTIAILQLDNHVIDRFAAPGRYAPEFDSIGLNLSNLTTLANDTGGQVIAPPQTTPIQFSWPHRQIDLTSPLAISGAICLAAALLIWKKL
jgi:hypothetical protein